MEQHTGILEVWVTTSRAQLPVEGASVAVTQPEGDGRRRLIALLVTDGSGRAGPLSPRRRGGNISHSTAFPCLCPGLW